MLWGVAGVVVHLPMTGVMFGIAAVVSEPVLRFFEFGAVADWLLKGPLSGLIGVAGWLLILCLLCLAEFRIMQLLSPGGWGRHRRRPTTPT